MTESYGIRVDWLTLVLPAGRVDVLREMLQDKMGVPELRDYGRNFYSAMWEWENGAFLAFSQPDQLNGDTCTLVLKGKSLRCFTGGQLRLFMQACNDFGSVRCTRLDLAFDDFTRELLKLDDVASAGSVGNYAGFRSFSHQWERERGGLVLGNYCRFGKPGKSGGGRQVVFYDKTLESKGEIDAVRMESRFFKDHADEAFKLLAASDNYDQMEARIRSIMAGSISFVDRGNETHIERMSRLAWWVRVLDVLNTPVPIKVDRPVISAQQNAEWFKEIGAVTIANVFENAERQGQDAESLVLALLHDMREAGTRKLDQGKRPTFRTEDLDFDRLLCA